MPRLLIPLFIFSICSPSFSQYSQNIDSLSKKEIKRFLLEQDNKEIQIHLNKFRNRKVGGIILTGIGSTLITMGLVEHNKPADPRNELAWYNGMGKIVLGSLTTLGGIIIWGKSNLQFKKAKHLYVESYTPEAGGSFIRDERGYIKSH